ncbi:transposase [Gracilibacillus halotolerans]|uniref:Transposase n=1 Tax=Gracilibacillus halotolerans TaxID=74386 RepID=A0A841RRI6_9BACI|nr:IS21 family transposase [Gracilibacillus halotolerans]MBB6514432.1 transposase [Gracilibacillus halotolerans]
MLAMPEINHIKKLRNIKSLSINEISKRTGFSWVTVKKYADEEQLPEERIVKKKGMMYEEEWGEIVIDWLVEDYALKKKLRRNNKNIFEGLQRLGFPGSYRTVCNFIKEEWKEKTLDESDELKEEYERLTHPPAEAQIDFGVTEAIEDGKTKDIHVLVMSFPYSNAGYSVPLPAENQECFLDGLKMLFNQAGFVPRKLRLDNLTAAVVKARGHGRETIFNEEFLRFANHYGFEAQACNARKGNEKGHVENKVGYVRYNFFTPSPVIKDLTHLRDLLFEQFQKDHQRLHYKKDIPITDLFEEEMKYGLALPESDYPVFKKTMVVANKYGEVSIDGELIHVPKSYHYGKMNLVLYWDTYKVVSQHGEMLSTGPRPYMNQAREIPWQSILKNWRQKPRSIVYSRYFPYLPGRIAYYLNIESMKFRKERVEWLLSLIVTHDIQEIDDRFYELLPGEEQFEEGSDDSTNHPYDVDWSIYDSLQPTDKSTVKEGV